MTTEQINKLKTLDDKKLLDVVKNYRQYGYTTELRNEAINILKSRDISLDFIKFSGNLENEHYNKAEHLCQLYSKNSKVCFLFYGIAFILMTFILTDNITGIGSAMIFILTLLIYVTFFVFLLKASFHYNEFYKLLDKEKGVGDQLIFFALGIPLFFVAHFYFLKQMKNDLTRIK